MKRLLLAALLLASLASQATDVGIFDITRLYSISLNIQTGANMSKFRSIWEARGAVWHQTPTLTSSFLSGVSVFVTSSLNTTKLSADEQTALIAWVQGGGTLVVTGECL